MWVFFQFAYIHNSAHRRDVLLLGAGCSGWLAHARRPEAGLWLGAAWLPRPGLARVETVFFALAFSVQISLQRFAPGIGCARWLLFTAVLLGWYGWLLLVARPDTKFLTPSASWPLPAP
jgi:hypothetical protein